MTKSSLRRADVGRRRRTTPDERRQWVEAWERSDRTQVEFAAAHGLNLATFRNWIRRAGGRSALAEAPAFVEVDLDQLGVGQRSSSPPVWEFEVRWPDGRVLAVASTTSVDRVRALVEALRC